ncbi:GNAT family N-acetyltransferase [Streptomyces botrytidirepellens]|uniref:N-acetyltransferase n=1 Tax=Streptomyces botrytidirepellens TaxID=2486417 RepID=A0A3M8VS98_9ACTN|nr:GNAT family N-acetyltransferase [Streptomyces botrytidirepellens]RNG18643.1 N-acetyltransferase [Streptomyces botrytidirepellens]
MIPIRAARPAAELVRLRRLMFLAMHGEDDPKRPRGRGYARATTEALLDWFAGQGVTRVDLHATEGAEELYRSLGFAEHSIALSLDLSRRRG